MKEAAPAFANGNGIIGGELGCGNDLKNKRGLCIYGFFFFFFLSNLLSNL